MHRFSLINILSREKTDVPINYGRIDTEKLTALKQLLPFASYQSIYICGPEQMIYAAADFFEGINIPKNKIHFELFTTPGQKQQIKQTIILESIADAGPTSKVSVKLDGRSVDFNLGYNSQNILDAALLQGADLPYACKGGVCCTCRAKLVSGEVMMDANYALEPEEVAQGFILTCQSHPRSECVVVDFDIK